MNGFWLIGLLLAGIWVWCSLRSRHERDERRKERERELFRWM